LEAVIAEGSIFWDTLLQLIDEGEVVPVIGQDLLTVPESTGHKLLYPYLATRLAEYLGIPADNLPVDGELNEVACRFLAQGNQVQDVYAALKVVATKAEALPVPDPLQRLAAIRPFRLFVTTTFDGSLARALNQKRFGGNPKTRVLAHSPSELEDLPGALDNMDAPVVYHLLGRLSATPAYAVTQEDIVEFFHSLQSETRKPNLLFDELNRRNLLMVGSGFGGWLMPFFMRMSKRQRLSVGGKTDYVADAELIADKTLVGFLKSFCKATKMYRDGGAVEFVNELSDRWMALHPDGAATPAAAPRLTEALSEPGAVFLSYASGDSAAVERIKNALEAAGVDVFFDREQLQPGNDWDAKLRRNIRECSLFVPVISRQTLTSDRRYFRAEWNLALEEAKRASFSAEQVFLFPVVIDDTSIDEPALPEGFRQVQWKSLPAGEPTPDFVSRVQSLHRQYLKARSNA